MLQTSASTAADVTVQRITGCKTSTAALKVLRQVISLEEALIDHASVDRLQEVLKSAIALLQELEPRTGTEALLAAQMIGTQRLAMVFLARGAANGQTFEGVNANIGRAVRLMRLFNEQLEALAKLKGKSGQQHVVVEHVTVEAGGRAIVGAVLPRAPMTRNHEHDDG